MSEHLTARLADFPIEIQRQMQAFLARSPRRFHIDRFDRLTDVEPALGEGGPHGLLVKGPTGTGKTRLAVALLAHVLEEVAAPVCCEIVHARAFFRRLWSTYRNESDESESSVMDHYANEVALLVIDDLGHEGRVSDAVVGALHEVLTLRAGIFRTSIITTNLGRAELQAQYDPAVASRLGLFDAMTLVGIDRRGRGARLRHG